MMLCTSHPASSSLRPAWAAGDSASKINKRAVWESGWGQGERGAAEGNNLPCFRTSPQGCPLHPRLGDAGSSKAAAAV